MPGPPKAGEAERRPPGVELARVLATSGGFVDAVGYVALFHLFTAHQSGNSDGLGVALGFGQWTIAWRRFSAIGAYVVGVLFGTLIVEQCRTRWRPRWSGVAVAGAELLALATALGVGVAVSTHGRIAPVDTAGYASAATSLAAAMGLQNVILRRVGSDRTPTTFVSGILTTAAELFVLGVHQRRDEGRRPTLKRSGFLGSLWVLYLAGAVAGAAGERAWGFGALGVPMAVVAGVIGWQARSGFQPSLTPPSQAGEAPAGGPQTSGQG